MQAKQQTPRLRFRPKARKLAELLLYLAHKKQHVDHYKACKLVYLADREHFNKFGRPIASDSHVAMEWGPVAGTALDLLKQDPRALKAAGLETLPFETKKLDNVIVIGAPKRAVDKQFFSHSDLAVFDQIVAEYGEFTFDQLHNVTSEHFAYKNAWDQKPAARKSALMSYDDMLDETADKEQYIDEIAPLAHKM